MLGAVKKIKEQQRGARDGLKVQGEGSDMEKMHLEEKGRRRARGQHPSCSPGTTPIKWLASEQSNTNYEDGNEVEGR